ncbi:MAG: hypothetical protein ACYCX7_08570 [Solirubrobacteraceae bacterium]
MTRLRRAWQALDHERRLAAVAAVALLLTMVLPWYQQNGVVHGIVVSRDLNAFAVFSGIEALILLVALAVLALLFAVAERHELPLPEMEGSLVLGGGSFAALLLVIRLFDKPGVSGNGGAVDVGVQWGIFFALAAVALLIYAGARMRAVDQEPPLPRARRGWRGPSGPAPTSGSFSRADGFPGREDERAMRRAPRELPRPEVIDVVAQDTPPAGSAGARRAPAARRERSEAPARDSEQLSFEDDTARS